MVSVAIVVTSYDPEYLRITEHLVQQEVSKGSKPVAIDITPLIATPVDSYHRGVLRVFGHDYPGNDIAGRLEEAGAIYLNIDELNFPDEQPPLPEDHQATLDIAVESALITFFRTDKPDRARRHIGAISDALREEGHTVYTATRLLTKHFPNLTSAYVPNGRFPHQKMATVAFHEEGIPTIHLEKGATLNRAYVQNYAPQNRLKSQSSVDMVLEGLSPDEIDGLANAWLEKRAPSQDSANEFSTLWDNEVPAALKDARQGGKSVAGFFTSSQDEFQFLGAEWHLQEWENQFEAFDVIMNELEKQGYVCYLRVHPNLATKAHDCFVRERDGVRWLAQRHPGLIVIWHDDSANTYSLFNVSDAIVVWYSTVGLEASARGLPVWTTAASRYGLVADVKQLLSAEAVTGESTQRWDVDRHKANRFITYTLRRDEDISHVEGWTEWDPASPPRGVALAAIAVSGGIPGVWSAVKSLFDVYRHRSFRANIRALTRR